MPATVTRSWLGGRGAPAFLASTTPTLSWQVATAPEGWSQVAARVELDRDGVIASVELQGDASQSVAWPFAPLEADGHAAVRVAVCGGDGVWSDPGDWMPARTAALEPGAWRASFIASPLPVDDDRRTTRFRAEFDVAAPIASAVLSITAHGVYEAVINGRVVGDEVLAPGWTVYDRRLTVQSYDVTDLVVEGRNVIGATVAEGWYRERFGFDGAFAVAYAGPVALSARLRIVDASGREQVVVTGSDWMSSVVGPVVAASIYQGETFDARLDDSALAAPGETLPAALPAVVVDADPDRLVASSAPPVRRIRRLAPSATVTSPSGAQVVDFGQNLVGWVELDLDVPSGVEIVLRHAEVLENGELATRPLRHAAATDRFIGDGRGRRTWSPRFTFHGFRYVEISGIPLDDVTVHAVVVHSDLEQIGSLVTSAPLLNQLHANVEWGMRGNFLSIPTDCPQRDERLGWTGDIQVFAPTAGYLFDTSTFLDSWLVDLALEQTPSGVVPMVVPDPTGQNPLPAAAWGDAAALVPDTLYRQTGDIEALRRHYPAARAWVECVRAVAGDTLLWSGGFQFGDWLDPTAPPHNPADAKTDSDIVATAYFAHSTRRLAAAAAALDLLDDAREYGDLAGSVAAAFAREYLTPAGRLMSDAHTAYTVAIMFDLIPDPEQLAAAGRRLAQLVRAHDYRIRTGFVGTPLICDALHRTGHTDVAYRLLTEEGLPSWLYPITMGATTIWERWDSMLPDGSVNPGEMTSFNHYALGAVADWMHRVIGGIAPARPGYREIEIAPVPGGGITSARASLDSGLGTIAVSWSVEEGEFALDAVVPVGATAVIRLPDGSAAHRVGHGRHAFRVPFGVGEPVRGRVGLDTALGAIVDDRDARAVLFSEFDRIGYPLGFAWGAMGMWRDDTSLADALVMFPGHERPALSAALDRLNAAREAPTP